MWSVTSTYHFIGLQGLRWRPSISGNHGVSDSRIACSSSAASDPLCRLPIGCPLSRVETSPDGFASRCPAAHFPLPTSHFPLPTSRPICHPPIRPDQRFSEFSHSFDRPVSASVPRSHDPGDAPTLLTRTQRLRTMCCAPPVSHGPLPQHSLYLFLSSSYIPQQASL